MNNILTRETLIKAAVLAKIEISEDETVRYLQDINAILTSAENLQKINTDGIKPTVSPIQNAAAPFREDVVKPSLSQADVLKEAAQKDLGHFRVPRTVEG